MLLGISVPATRSAVTRSGSRPPPPWGAAGAGRCASARPNAPVATPVTWEELDDLKSAATFTIGDMEGRLKGKDPALAVKPQTLGKAVIARLEKRVG